VSRLARITGDPIGTFHPVTVRDAASVSREGFSVYACRELDPLTVEVLFRDGCWLLCAHEDVDLA
jgi:hypothetical protein